MTCLPFDLKVHLKQLLGNTGEVLVLVTSVQQEAEDQDFSGCAVQKAPGALSKAKKRQRCNSSWGEMVGTNGCTGSMRTVSNCVLFYYFLIFCNLPFYYNCYW